MKLTQRQLDQWLAKWLKILRLRDWDVHVKLIAARDENHDSFGTCHHKIRTKTALIKITDPIDQPRDLVTPVDPEQVLVHELLHLHHAPFESKEDDDQNDIAQEQAIDLIAQALVSLERGTSSS